MSSKPSVTTVIGLLKNAGFQCSRYTDSMSQPASSGATVRESSDKISVHWNEGDADFIERMNNGGHTDVRDVPKHPLAADYVREYAEILACRYNVATRGAYLTVTGRDELPARPKGLPYAAAVRRALREAGLNSGTYSAVDLHSHIRVAVTDEDALPAVLTALEEQGWIIGEKGENWQHIYLKITGATADRPARLRTLRAARKAAQAAQEAAPAAQTEESTQQARQEPQEAPEQPAPAPAPAARPERHYSASGTSYRVGTRVTYRTPDGMWHHGAIDKIEPGEDGALQVHFTVDAYQVAPPRRRAKNSIHRPGKRRVIAPRPYTVPLDDKDLTREQ